MRDLAAALGAEFRPLADQLPARIVHVAPEEVPLGGRLRRGHLREGFGPGLHQPRAPGLRRLGFVVGLSAELANDHIAEPRGQLLQVLTGNARGASLTRWPEGRRRDIVPARHGRLGGSPRTARPSTLRLLALED
eukprot:3460896-Alexandrium_andersonii.AAC.1